MPHQVIISPCSTFFLLLPDILLWTPTNNALPTNFFLSSDAEISLTSPDLSIQRNAQKTCVRRVHIPTDLPFCMPPLVVGTVLIFFPHS